MSKLPIKTTQEPVTPDYPLEIITWIDHIKIADQWSAIVEHDMEMTMCHTVGFVINETDDAIKIIPNIEQNSWLEAPRGADERILIKSAITKRVKLQAVDG